MTVVAYFPHCWYVDICVVDRSLLTNYSLKVMRLPPVCLLFASSLNDTNSYAATLSFLTYFVLKKPEVLRKLRAELDEVLGNEPPQLSDLNKLPYLAGASAPFTP